MEHLRYPIGRFESGQSFTDPQFREFVLELEQFPQQLRTRISTLNPTQLGKTYREGSWTVLQLVHHLAESHLNAYMRVKLALTEDQPVIKPYVENLWVQTPENALLGPEVSLNLIEAIHLKLVTLLQTLDEVQQQRTFVHPQYQRVSSIRDLAALYSWHGKHHLAHIGLALG